MCFVRVRPYGARRGSLPDVCDGCGCRNDYEAWTCPARRADENRHERHFYLLVLVVVFVLVAAEAVTFYTLG